MSDAVARPKKRSTISLWLLIAVCVAPLAASYLAYFFWRPQSHVNYGELLEPRPLPDPALALTDGAPFRLSGLRNKWVLLVAQPGTCEEHCRQQLLYLRQVRLAQGRDSDRIERVWLLTDERAPDAELLAQFPGLYVVRAAGSPLLPALPAERSPSDHIYVVDLLGNLMMRYPPDVDAGRMLKDIGRLLRHSKWST
jgi:hypothetical protein